MGLIRPDGDNYHKSIQCVDLHYFAPVVFQNAADVG